MKKRHRHSLTFGFVLLFVILILISRVVMKGTPNIGVSETMIATNAPISILFSEEMDRKSVEKAFSISPKTEGRFEWKDEKNLLFYSVSPFDSKLQYTIAIGTEAETKSGTPLPKVMQQTFSVAAPLTIEHTSPADETEVENVDSITIRFDRELAISTKEAASYFDISPKTEGTWSISSFSAIFSPKTPLSYGETFIVTIKKGLPATDQSTFPVETSFSFHTSAPKIVETMPQNGALSWSTEKPIILKWNQNINLDSLYERLSLEPNTLKSKRFPGTIALDPENPKFILLTPEPLLKHKQTYTLRIEPGVKSFFGSRTTSEPFELKFTVE